MATTKNLCAQISFGLHQKISEVREAVGLTTAQYITELLTEYFKMKENGGNITMTNNNTRTLTCQISEELFQRTKAYLERETQHTGRKLIQRGFVLGLIEESLPAAERQARETGPNPEEQAQEEVGANPCEAQSGGASPSSRIPPVRAVWSRGRARRTVQTVRMNNGSNRAVQTGPMGTAWAALAVQGKKSEGDLNMNQPEFVGAPAKTYMSEQEFTAYMDELIPALS